MHKKALSSIGLLRDRAALRRLTALLALCLSLGGMTSRAVAGLLVPSDYAPVGGLLSESGTYQVDTTAGTMTLPDGRIISGVFSDGVAVFTFGAVQINGATFDVQGNSPFALLAEGNLTLTGVTIDASAQGQTPGPGGDENPIGQGAQMPIPPQAGAGGGGFGGAGGQGGPYIFAGSPLLKPMFWYVPGGTGGATYGGLAAPIQGGSAGGYALPGEIGGAGGGAVELGAGRNLTLTGVAIDANGGSGTDDYQGGGSGGSISLLGHTVDVDATSSLSVAGGDGGSGTFNGGPGGFYAGGGGGGGGGRIDIVADQLDLLGSYDLAGGDGGEGTYGDRQAAPGGAGVLEILTVPEPSGLLMALSAVAAGVAGAARGRIGARRRGDLYGDRTAAVG